MKKVFTGFGILFLSLFMMVGIASANLIQTGSFESPDVSGTGHGKWAVYHDVGSWYLLSGQGIEIQTSGTVVNAQAGNQYIELDSDANRHVGYATAIDANVPTNSTMGQDIVLTAGTYNLSFWYRPRTDSVGTNGIKYGMWNSSGSSFGPVFGTVDGKSSDFTDWVQYTHSFSIDNDATYTLAFAAVGTSDNRGGFIDNVELNAVPIPGALWLLGSGLLGLVGIRRRHSKA